MKNEQTKLEKFQAGDNATHANLQTNCITVLQTNAEVMKTKGVINYTKNHKPPIPPKPKIIPKSEFSAQYYCQKRNNVKLESLRSLHDKLSKKDNVDHINGLNFQRIHVTSISIKEESSSTSSLENEEGLSSNLDLKHNLKNGHTESADDVSSSLMEKTLENCFISNSNRISQGSSSLSESDSDEFLPSYPDCDLSSQSSSNSPSNLIPDSQLNTDSPSPCGDHNPVDLCEKTRAKKAFLVAQEIMTSERTFVSILKLLNVEFRQFLADKDCFCPNNEINSIKIQERELNELFKFLPNLQSLNEEILNDFQNRITTWDSHPKIADIIVKKGPFLKLYTNYIKELQSLTDLLRDLTDKHRYFGDCVKEFQQSEACGKIPIHVHMLTPLQRITKYKELMRQYMKHLPEDGVDYQDALHASDIVKDVAEHANEAINQMENSARLLSLQDRLNGITNGDVSSSPASMNLVHLIVEPGRSLVKEGQLMKLCRRGIRVVYLILLSDTLLYTIEEPHGGKNCPLKLRHKLPLEGMRVDLPKSEDFQNEFSVISTSRSFTVRANSARERDAWIRALQNSIDSNANRRWSFQSAKTADFELLSSHILGKQAPAWIPDNRVTMCQGCTAEFTFTFRRHHCRACGKVVCRYCSDNRAPLSYRNNQSERVCDNCFVELEEIVGKMENLHSLEDEETPENFKDKIRDLKTRFRKGVRDNKRTRSRKPERLLEVSGGDSGSQMCGYLKQFCNKRSWRLGWFVLKDKVLYEYRAPEDVCALSSLPVLGYNVTSEFELTDIFDGMDPENAFQLLHPNQTPIIFYSESLDLSQKWRLVMEEAVVL